MVELTPEQERLLSYLDKILLELRGAILDENIPKPQRDLLAARQNSILVEYGVIL